MINETPQQTDERFMRIALDEAHEAARRGEVPIGAVIVSNGRVIAKGSNMTEQLNDVCAHAEIIAITGAAEYLGGKYLENCTIYVTVEPCIMCAGALGWSHIGRIVYGTPDPKAGYRSYATHRSPLHPKSQITSGVLAEECRDLMQSFFKSRRKKPQDSKTSLSR